MAAAFKAGAAYFAVVFMAGFMLGVLRVVVLMPRFGETVAVLAELPAILLVSWIVCGWLVVRFSVPAAPMPRLAMGGTAFLLLMAAEFALAFFAFGRPMEEIAHHYQTLAGALGLAGQLAFAAFPYLMLKAPPR